MARKERNPTIPPEKLHLLTPRQREVWELRFNSDPPLTFSEIADHLDIAEDSARSIWMRAKHAVRDGVPLGVRAQKRANGRKKGGASSAMSQRTEVEFPEFGAKAIDHLLNPINDNVAEVARDLGISQTLARHIKLRVEKHYLPLTRELGSVTSAQLKDLFGVRAYEIAASVTKEDIDDASLKDKMIAAGIATDKHQLLAGQPTEIFSLPQLENLDKLAAILTKVAERRGKAVLTDPETQEVRMIRMETEP